MQPNNQTPAAAPHAPTAEQIQADQALTLCRDVATFALHVKLRAASVNVSADARQHCFQHFVELARLFRPPE